MGLKCSQTVRFVGLKQLLLIVFAIEYANAVELFVVSINTNENMAKKKSWKTRPLELDHPNHNPAVKKHVKVVTEASCNW